MAELRLKTHKEVNESPSVNLIRAPFPDIEDLPVDLQTHARLISSHFGNGQKRNDMFPFILRDIVMSNVADNHHKFGTSAASDEDSDLGFLIDEQNGTNLNARALAQKRKSIYGNLMSQGAFNKNITVYNPDKLTPETYERMQKHATVNLCLDMVNKPIEHVNFAIESSEEKVQALVEYNLQLIFPKLIRNILTAITYGNSAQEKVYYKIKRLKITRASSSGDSSTVFDGEANLLNTYAMHPKTYGFRLNKNGELIAIAQRPLMGGADIIISRKNLVFYANDMQFGNWAGNSRLKNAYPWWYWSEIILQFLIRYLERRSSPPVKVGVPDGFTKDNKGKRVSNLAIGLAMGNSLMSNSVVSHPNIYNKEGKPLWTIEYMTDDQRFAMFIEVLNFVNLQIARALGIPDNVAQQSGSDGNSVADARTDIHLMNEEALIKEIENIINKDIIPYILRYNFKPEERVPCSIKIERLTIMRKQLLKETILKLLGVFNEAMRNGAIFNVMPDMAEMCRLLDIPFDHTENIMDMSQYSPGGSGGASTDIIKKDEVIKQNNKDKKRPPRDRSETRKKTA